MIAHLFALKAPPSLEALPSSAWIEFISEPKRTHILNQRNAQAASSQLCAHMLMLYGLNCAYGIDASSLTYACTPKGKPYFTGSDVPHFSLSHSGAMALCAVHRAPVGADVERIRTVTPALARRIMSDAEYAFFCNSEKNDDLFFKIWALKESYLKQTGQGIAFDLKTLSFTIDGQNITFNIPDYSFRLYDLTDGYQACACVAQGTLPTRVTYVPMDKLTAFSYR